MAAATPKHRAPRARTVHVDEDALLEEWRPLAQLRSTSIAWDGSLYSKSRNQGVDKEGLIRHKKALVGLCRAAPSGFPSMSSVRGVLLRLEKEFGVLQADPKFVFKVATEAADSWRIMMKHVYTYKKRKSVPKELRELTDLLIDQDIPTSEDGAPDASMDGSEMVPQTHEDVDAMFGLEDFDVSDSSSDDLDCEIVAVTCRCAECMSKPRIADPGVGKQRQETRGEEGKPVGKPPVTRRCSTKQPQGGPTKKPRLSERTRPGAQDRDLMPPFQIAYRRGRREAVLKAAGRYVVAVTRGSDGAFDENLKTLLEKLRANEITTLFQARRFIRSEQGCGANV